MSGEAAPPAYQGVPIPESKDTKVTLLLSIPNVSVNQIYNGEQLFLARGLLELSCIPADPDSYLVLKTGEVEVVLTPDSRVFKKGNDGLYVPWTELPGAILFFDLAACDLEAVETLDTYLVSYTSMPAPETNLRNQLALVDEHGQVVGEIECDNTQDLKRPAIERTDSSKEPVLVDLDHDGHLNVEKFKDSKIVKGGTYVSSGILYGADVLSSSVRVSPKTTTAPDELTQGRCRKDQSGSMLDHRQPQKTLNFRASLKQALAEYINCLPA